MTKVTVEKRDGQRAGRTWKSLPVGTYSMTIERVRKVRNKPYYRIHYRLEDGSTATGIMRP